MKGSKQIAAELERLEQLTDSEIDKTEIPEVVDWTGAVRGRFRRKAGQSRSTSSLKRMTDEQKAEIRRLLGQERSRYDIAEEVGVTPGQVAAIKAWIKMRGPSVDPHEPGSTESDEIVEAVETTFGLERDLQAWLRRNIAHLEPGLTIVDGDRERRVKSGGRIDILAKDGAGGTVVIELKAGLADRDAIGQILAYMGELMEGATPVRGILVAAEFSPRTIAAARAAPSVRLIRYGIQFSFKPLAAQSA